MLLVACDDQDPAFTEDRSATRAQGDDATVKAAGQDGGVEAFDPSTLPDGGDAGSRPNGGSTPDGDSGTVGQDADGSGSDAADSDGGTGTGDGSGDVADGGGGTDTGDSGGGTDTAGDGAGDTTGGDASDASGGDGGTTLVQRTVELTQRGPGMLDILWVVDTSGSMSEEQQYLANNFNMMISALNDAGHDFQTAVTTTDVCQDTLPDDLAQRVCPADYGGSAATHLRGSFRGTAGRKVLKRGDADLVSKFNTYTSAGVNGSGFEHGLEAAHLAVQKVIAGQNEALIRPGAFLAVIVVSDEQDDGIGLSQTDAYSNYNFKDLGLTTFRWTEDDMITYLKGVKGEGKFSISAITPTRLANGSLCTAPHSQPLEEGTQYIQAAAKSGGLLQSICETNWSNSLTTLGLDLDAQLSQVVLPSAPNVPTIQVKVNGVANTQWTYNAGNNAVKFNTGHVPAEGAQIQVKYYQMQ